MPGSQHAGTVRQPRLKGADRAALAAQLLKRYEEGESLNALVDGRKVRSHSFARTLVIEAGGKILPIPRAVPPPALPAIEARNPSPEFEQVAQDYRRTLAVLVRAIRTHRGITMEHLVPFVGAKANLAYFERGRFAQSMVMIGAIAAACEVDMYDVMTLAYVDALWLNDLVIQPVLTRRPAWRRWAVAYVHMGQPLSLLPFAQWCCGNDLRCECGPRGCQDGCEGCGVTAEPLALSRQHVITGGKPSSLRVRTRKLGSIEYHELVPLAARLEARDMEQNTAEAEGGET